MAARKIDSSISAVLLHAELYLYFAVKESGMNKPAEKGLVGGVKRMTKKGGELIAEFLVKEKIPYVFGICGHGNVGLLDPLYEVRDQVKLVSPRHEQTAGHMADGYFRVKHKPVATLTSTGPGSANLIMALAVAQTDPSALLAITANVPTSQLNRGAFQELNRHNQADFPNVIRPVVKRSFQPTRVDMLPLALRQAITTATSGRPGPVNLDVPYNLFQEEAEVELEQPWDGFDKRRSGASPEDVQKVVELLAQSRRPVLFIGHGAALSEAGKELTEFAKKYGIPVISSPNGRSTSARTSRSMPRPSARNASWPTAARCCPTTRSSRSTRGFITTGSCSSGKRAGRRPC